MTTTIQTKHIQSNQNCCAADGISAATFEAIDSDLLSAATGGSDALKQLGKNMQSTGEVAMAVGAVGTVTPAAGTGAPEAAAAAGGATWLLGKGVSALGTLF